MRVIICGGRNFSDKLLMDNALEEFELVNGKIKTVIHGAASGADSLADAWAREHNLEVLEFPANWKEHGKAAGPIRNRQMLIEGHPEFVIAFPGGRGTKNMLDQATKAHIHTHIIQDKSNKGVW